MKKIVLMLVPLLLATPAWAAPTPSGQAAFAQALGHYKKGAYAQALKVLATAPAGGVSSYWTGICQARLQKFDLAARSFADAARLGFKAEDLSYELGQALYASQQLRPAREAFKKSIDAKYKVGPSRYYIGYISQILEENTAAIASYQSLQSLSREQDVDKVKQAALFQLAELRYSSVRSVKDSGDRNRVLRREVLPKYEVAMNYEQGTAANFQAAARVNEIRKVLGTDIPRYANGVPIPAKRWLVRGTQDVKYDSNVVAEANQAASRVSNAASAISKTSLFAKIEYVVADRWSVSPDLGLDYTYHLNRTVPSVFSNDQVSLLPALRLRNEHRYSDQPAAALFDVEFNTVSRDTNQTHTLIHYTRYFNFTAGERARFLSASGNLTIQGGFKVLTHTDDDQSTIEPGLTLIQNLPMGGRDNLSLTLAFTDVIAKLDTYSKLNSRAAATYSLSDLFWNLNANVGVDLTFSKLRNSAQNDARGMEITILPTAGLRKDFNDVFFTSLNFSYTKQVSKDESSYAYSKSVLGLSLGALL